MRYRRSLTLRLTLLFSLASVLVLAMTGIGFYAALDRHFLHEDAIELQGKRELITSLVAQVRTTDDFEVLGAKLREALVGHRNLALELSTADGRRIFAVIEEGFPLDALRRVDASTKDIEGLPLQSAVVNRQHFTLTRLVLPTRLADIPRMNALLAMNVDHHRMFMDRMRETVFLLIVPAIMLAAALGWMAARIGIAPLRILSSLTSRTSASRLHDRLDTSELPPELQSLGDSFNGMLARLEESFKRLKDFSSDLAHELRTPVSALMTQAQVALSRARSAEEYREVIYSALEEYDRLARMITDMLFLAKADHGLLVPLRETVDLRNEVLALFDFYDALVESKGVRLATTGSGAVDGDRLMIRRALSNLLSNAVRHAPPGSSVDVDIVSADGRSVALAVTNEGPAIPAEHLQRVFERFHRVDPARERSSDGAGLGLSITKSIVAAHGGSIAARSRDGKTTFEMTLPIRPDDASRGGDGRDPRAAKAAETALMHH